MLIDCAMKYLKWVELDARAPDWNLGQLRERSGGGGVKVCAVVKSNAYGHGVSRMVPLLPSADWFAVNSLEEGLELRGMGVEKPVLILGHVLLDRLKEAVDARLSLTVYNVETLDGLGEVLGPGGESRIHVKVETGTGRQGIMPGEVPGFIAAAEAVPGVVVEGISTHFANIEDTLNHDYAERQMAVFTDVLEELDRRGKRPPVVHTACTAAAILFPETHFDMLRVGIGIYGLWPSRETYLSAKFRGEVPDLKPVLSWKTRVVQVKELPAGSYIGYGCSYRTNRRTILGVLPVGYADGYDRRCGNTAHVLVKGKRAPVVGRVCMNLTMIDLTDVPGVGLEDEVVLLGRDGDERISAETMAGWVGTINYEIVTRISPFLPRVVAGRGEE